MLDRVYRLFWTKMPRAELRKGDWSAETNSGDPRQLPLRNSSISLHSLNQTHRFVFFAEAIASGKAISSLLENGRYQDCTEISYNMDCQHCGAQFTDK